MPGTVPVLVAVSRAVTTPSASGAERHRPAAQKAWFARAGQLGADELVRIALELALTRRVKGIAGLADARGWLAGDDPVCVRIATSVARRTEREEGAAIVARTGVASRLEELDAAAIGAVGPLGAPIAQEQEADASRARAGVSALAVAGERLATPCLPFDLRQRIEPSSAPEKGRMRNTENSNIGRALARSTAMKPASASAAAEEAEPVALPPARPGQARASVALREVP